MRGINRGLGVPAAFYHFAFEAGSAAALADKHDELRAKGVETTDIVDHGWAKSIYFEDPNGLSLEYCCMVRNLNEDDATMQERFTIPRGALDLNDTITAKVPAARAASRNPQAARLSYCADGASLVRSTVTAAALTLSSRPWFRSSHWAVHLTLARHGQGIPDEHRRAS